MERNPMCLLSKHSLWIFVCAHRVLINEARKMGTWVIGPHRRGFLRKSMCKWTVTAQTKSEICYSVLKFLKKLCTYGAKMAPCLHPRPWREALAHLAWNADSCPQKAWHVVSPWVLPLPCRTATALSCRCQMRPLPGIFPSTCSQQSRRHQGRKGR